MISNISRNIFALAALSLMLAWPEYAWALQSHGEPEGLYVHQIAHILFAGALAYLVWHTRRTQEFSERGWKYLQLFCLLTIAWNVIAFTGHQVQEYLSIDDFLNKGSWHELITYPITIAKALHYLTKMDHLLFTPALLALMISLRCFYRDALTRRERRP
ncbi:MAG: hypothetical protein N839_0003030 [Desulfofustis sp. PB-SRB1]|jgi:cell division protein FtsW (lipid II flippase)|nr:hypothetical protein [Desulfofustis sp. PB-SRB1]MBM1001365.1 hypothetical protein [Desulfofustis sp. PB-SRB1]HBH28354.1 hypothetical protein [Desulfofustis sp.]HBH31036.1 hypothetical protein [Desulfofustis sp.]